MIEEAQKYNGGNFFLFICTWFPILLSVVFLYFTLVYLRIISI